MANPKQVLILRRDLIRKQLGDEGLGLFFGKYCAMSAHASVNALLYLMNQSKTLEEQPLQFTNGKAKLTLEIEENSALHLWLSGIYTKICVFVDSEEELKAVYDKAKGMNLPVSYITDLGLTLFNNETNAIAVGIGPAERRKVDKVTRGLPTDILAYN